MRSYLLFAGLFLSIASHAQQLVPFQEADGKFGYKDATGAVVIPAQYQGALPFVNGKALVNDNGKINRINTAGAVLFSYDGAQMMNEKFLLVAKNKDNKAEIGLINTHTGEEVVPPKFHAVEKYTDKLLQTGINQNGGWLFGLLDAETGKELIAPKYHMMADLFDKMFIRVYNVENNTRKMGLVAMSNGREVVPPIYDDIMVSKENKGFYTIIKQGKYGLMDNTGKVVVSPLYDEKIWGYSTTQPFPVKKNGKSGYIDHRGNTIIPFIYDFAGSFSEENYGNAIVWMDNRKGMIDPTGKVVIPIIYENMGLSFKEGLIDVEKDGRYGFIDRYGNVVVPFKYDMALSFSEGLAVVELNKKEGYVDRSGKVVIPIIYDDARSFQNGRANVILNKPRMTAGMEASTYMKLLVKAEYYIDKSGNRIN